MVKSLICVSNYAREKLRSEAVGQSIRSKNEENMKAKLFTSWSEESAFRTLIASKAKIIKREQLAKGFFYFMDQYKIFSRQRSLKKRSDLLKKYFSYKTFIRASFHFLEITKQERENNYLADTLYSKKLLEKGLGLFEYNLEISYRNTAAADFLYNKQLLIKGILGMRHWFESEWRAVPTYTSRQAYIGLKYLGEFTGQTELGYQLATEELKNYQFSLRESFSNEELSLSSRPRNSYEMVNTFDINIKLPKITNRIRPEMLQLTSGKFEFEILKNSFYVLKRDFLYKKQFYGRMNISKLSKVFLCWKEFYYKKQYKNYLEEKMIKFRTGLLLNRSLNSMKIYLPKKKIIRKKKKNMIVISKKKSTLIHFIRF